MATACSINTCKNKQKIPNRNCDRFDVSQKFVNKSMRHRFFSVKFFFCSEWIPRTDLNSNESFTFWMLVHSIEWNKFKFRLAIIILKNENFSVPSPSVAKDRHQSEHNFFYSNILLIAIKRMFFFVVIAAPIRLAGTAKQLKCKWNSKWPSTFYYLTLLPICSTQNSNEADCVVREAEWRHTHTHTRGYRLARCSLRRFVCALFYACVGPHCASNNGKSNTYCYANLHTI